METPWTSSQSVYVETGMTLYMTFFKTCPTCNSVCYLSVSSCWLWHLLGHLSLQWINVWLHTWSACEEETMTVRQPPWKCIIYTRTRIHITIIKCRAEIMCLTYKYEQKPSMCVCVCVCVCECVWVCECVSVHVHTLPLCMQLQDITLIVSWSS